MDAAADPPIAVSAPLTELARRLRSPLDGPAQAVAGERAAVLILLYERHDAPHLVLTKRTESLEHHPGQVSLPGGRWDPDDPDLAATALRETREELGVDPDTVHLVGRLPDVETLVSGFVVSPFIGVTHLPLSPVPSEREIARVLEVRVEDLLRADALLPESPDIRTLRYPLAGEDVWGATARILRSFARILRGAGPVQPGGSTLSDGLAGSSA